MSEATADAVEFVVFALGDRRFAVESGRVEEAVDLPAVTRVPGTTGSVEGVAELRGEATPVVDAAELLPEDPGERTPRTLPPGVGGAALADAAASDDPDRLLVADPGDGRDRVGIHVGRIDRVAVVELDDLQRDPDPDALEPSGIPGDLLAAAIRTADGPVPVLDVAAVADRVGAAD